MTTNRLSPGPLSGLSNIVAVSAGEGFNLTLDSTNGLWTWGVNDSGQLGDGTNVTRYGNNPWKMAGVTNGVAVAAGGFHSLVLQADGTVKAWGDNDWGQLGDGTVMDQSTPVAVAGLSNIVAIAAGKYHSLAMKSDGTVYVWGYHNYGQLGTGEYDYRGHPLEVPGATNIAALAAGAYFMLTLASNQTVVTWGDNDYGQLGDGTMADRGSSVSVQHSPGVALTNVTAISAGASLSLALTNGAGSNTWMWGAWADGTIKTNPALVTPVNLTNAIALAGGGSHNLALRTDHTVWAWGDNTFGQLGDNTTTTRTNPVQVKVSSGANLTSVTNLVTSGSSLHSLAISNGVVWAWGWNTAGQLGDNSTTTRTKAVKTLNLTGVSMVAAGTFHSLALSNDTVWAWGDANYGQLGTGGSDSLVPVFVTNGFKAIAAGSMHSLALHTNGTVWAWGWNVAGQLGNGTRSDDLNEPPHKKPAQVLNLSNIVAIAAGQLFSAALRNDGRVFTWGSVYEGALGDGNFGFTAAPVHLENIYVLTNVPPQLTVPESQTLLEDSTHLFPGFSVTDADSGVGKLNLTLSVTNGTLTLETTNALTFISGTNGTTTNLMVQGTLASLNNALTNLHYRPFTNYSGADRLNLLVNDLENHGCDGAKTDAKSVSLTVMADADGDSTPDAIEDANNNQVADPGERDFQLAAGVANPLSNFSLNTSRVNIQGTADFVSLKRVTVNGILAFLDGHNFEARNVPLAEGTNTIIILQEDTLGQQHSFSTTLTVGADPIDPVQLAATPPGGLASLSVQFTGTVAVTNAIQTVEWDFNGDHTPELTRSSLTTESHSYMEGEYFPVITVRTLNASYSSQSGWNASFLQGGVPLRIAVAQSPVIVDTINVPNPVDVKAMPNGGLYLLSGSPAKVYYYLNGLLKQTYEFDSGVVASGLDVDIYGRIAVALPSDHQVAMLYLNTNTFDPFEFFFFLGKEDKTAGTGNVEFDAPFDVAFTQHEMVISDANNHRIQRFHQGNFVAAFGSQGTQLGQLDSPKGLAYDLSGNLMLADSGNHRLAVARGGSILEIKGSAGAGLGQLQSPLHLGIGQKGIYVADTGNNRIQKFDSARATRFDPLWSISSELGLNQPHSVSPVDSLLEEKFWIADTGNNRVILAKVPVPTPEPAWTALKQHLLNSDLDGALSYFAANSVDKYRNEYTAIGWTALQPVINAIPPLTLVYIQRERAQYRFEQTVNGTAITFLVNFVWENGQWKILNY